MAFMGATDGVHFTITATDMASRTIRGVGNAFTYLFARARAADNRLHSFFWRGTDDVKMWARVILLSLPLVGGLLAATANQAAGLVSALVSMGPGVAAFAAAVIGNFEAIKKSAAFEEMQEAWEKFLVHTKPVALEAANAALGILSALLPRLVPIVKSFGDVFANWLNGIRESMNGSEFQEFLEWVRTIGALNFENTLNAIRNLGEGIGNLAMAFSSSGGGITQWLENITEKFRNWTASLRDRDTPALDRFFRFIREQWPPIRDMLVSFAAAVSNIVVALAPLGPHLARGLTAIFNAIADADPAHIRAVVLALLAFRTVNAALTGAAAGLGVISGALAGFKKNSNGVEDAGKRNERGFAATTRGATAARVGVAGAVAIIVSQFDRWIQKDAQLAASWERLKTQGARTGRALEQAFGPALRSILTTTFNLFATGAEKITNAMPRIQQAVQLSVHGIMAAFQVLLRGLASVFEMFGRAAAKLAPFNPALGKIAGAMLGAAAKARNLAGAIAALRSKTITVRTNFIETRTYISNYVTNDPVKGDSYGYAAGGRPPVGRASLIGERGPELFVPDRPGTILPADVTARLLNPTDHDAKAVGSEGTKIEDLLAANAAILTELAAIRRLLAALPRGLVNQRRLAGGTT